MESIGRIGLIGGGNMAEAFIKGLQNGGVAADNLMVSEPLEARRAVLAERYKIRTTDDNRDVVKSCDAIILAFKPQIVGEVVPGLADAYSDDKLLISILAGVVTRRIEGYFTGTPRVVRAMPNTPALVGQAATALCPGQNAGPEDLDKARKLFETLGTVVVVRENQMDAVTGVSGSGPGYIFTVIEALADGGVQEGLSRDTALSLAVQTVLGSAMLMRESGEHPAVLRDKVCSPAGTTISAIRVLEEKGLRSTLMEAVAQATKRSRELGKASG